MKWWVLLLIGVVWCASVGLVTALSLNGAEQAVADGLASGFGAAEVAVAIVSAIVFALPGIGFVAVGVRKQRRGH